MKKKKFKNSEPKCYQHHNVFVLLHILYGMLSRIKCDLSFSHFSYKLVIFRFSHCIQYFLKPFDAIIPIIDEFFSAIFLNQTKSTEYFCRFYRIYRLASVFSLCIPSAFFSCHNIVLIDSYFADISISIEHQEYYIEIQLVISLAIACKSSNVTGEKAKCSNDGISLLIEILEIHVHHVLDWI